MIDVNKPTLQEVVSAQHSKRTSHSQPLETGTNQVEMTSKGEIINRDEVQIAILWLKALKGIKYFLHYKLLIALVCLLFALGGYYKDTLLGPRYRASLTFALEQGGSVSSLGGLASQFGLSLGVSGDALGGDNLLTLLKSRRILQAVLLSEINTEDGPKLLINQYISSQPKLKAKWATQGLYPINPKNCCSKVQDSAIGVITKIVSEKSLAVAKVDKKQSFVTVTYEGHDEVFTGAFVELLTAKSTDFYVQTKMANAHANISKLEQRVDSVSAELQAAMVGYSAAQDQNSFTVQTTAKVPTMQKQMKVTMLTTLYGELVKNLELSKTMSAREEPLITIIDRPHYPLRVRESKLKSAAIGGVLGVFLTLLFLGGRAFLSDLNKQAAALKPKA